MVLTNVNNEPINITKLKAKIALHMPLTAKERAYAILYLNYNGGKHEQTTNR